MEFQFKLEEHLDEKLKSDLAGPRLRRMVLGGISEEDLFALRKKVASYAVGRELNEDQIRGLDSDSFSINELGYDKRDERYCCFEFFKHIGNCRRGSIAYFAGQREARIELA